MKFSFQRWQLKHVSTSDMAKLAIGGNIPAIKIFQSSISGNQIMVQLSPYTLQATIGN